MGLPVPDGCAWSEGEVRGEVGGERREQTWSDQAAAETDLDEVVAFVRDAARSLLGRSPDVFPVSARLAVWRTSRESELYQLSG